MKAIVQEGRRTPASHRAALAGLGLVLLILTPGHTAAAQGSQDSVGRVVLVGVTVFDGTGHPLRLAGAVASAAHRRGVTVVAGTDTLGSADAGSLTLPNLHQELELLVTLAGLNPAEALESATRHAAEVLGAGRVRGTVEVGKLADLVVLRRDPLLDIRNTRSIELVMKRGRVVRNLSPHDPPPPRNTP